MYINILYFAEYAVAPLVGAWIETSLRVGLSTKSIVAPLVGAWIETSSRDVVVRGRASHPSWVRGLKLLVLPMLILICLSHPSWVRGLKPERSAKQITTECRTPRGCVD